MILNPEKIVTLYWYAALIGTIVFILKTALPADTGAEVNTDFTSMSDSDASFSLFTIESVSAFFMCAGWTGWVAFSQLHYELKVAIVASVIAGVLGMLLFVWLISMAKKLEHIPAYNLTTLNGKSGKAYLHFEPKGSGKIQIEFNSKLDTIDAVSVSDEVIDAFAPIKVVKVENDTVYIDKNN